MLERRYLNLGRDQRGVAYIEFAITLPVVILLILGGLELTNLALAHLRINHIADTVADNAARVRTQMDENDVEEIFAAADATGHQIDLGNRGRVILSSVQDNGMPGANHGQMIRWQRCFGNRAASPHYGREGRGRSDASLRDGIGRPGRRIGAQVGTAVMFVEISYQYQPTIFRGLLGPREIDYESAYNVRERNELGITNVRGRPIRGC